MDQATRHRNGVTGVNQPRVSELLASAASTKMRWATTPVGDPASLRLLGEGAVIEAAIVRARSTSRRELQMKLTLLLDWLDETITPSGRLLLESAIGDLDSFQPGQTPPATPVRSSPPRPERTRSAVKADRRTPTISINRSARACTVDGVLFPSVIAAAKAYGIPYGQMRQLTLRG